EQLRLGDRLQVEWERREPLPLDLGLPRRGVQPLVENAVLHGISRLPGGGTVLVAVAMDDGALQVVVRNPAPPPAPPGLPARRAGDGAGHALRNIGHRLAYLYGDEARMAGGWSEGYYRVEVRLPARHARKPAGVAGGRAGWRSSSSTTSRWPATGCVRSSKARPGSKWLPRPRMAARRCPPAPSTTRTSCCWTSRCRGSTGWKPPATSRLSSPARRWCSAPRTTHMRCPPSRRRDRKSTRLNSSHVKISYAVFCVRKKHTVFYRQQ